jgi:hypothetical protein
MNGLDKQAHSGPALCYSTPQRTEGIMVKPILGGGAPTLRLFHYGTGMQGTDVRANSYWTDFESMNKDDISRITGQPAIYFKFRSMVQVSRASLNQYFINRATAMKPGLPAADEYNNKVPISVAFLETVPLP